jgi:hypothetical protein
MKNECNIARDLMPLCIDGAASEESRLFVETHVAACQPCTAYYQEMKSAIPAGETEETSKEQQNFSRAVQNLKKKRHQRVLRNVLIGVLAGVLIVCGIYMAWDFLYNQDLMDMPTTNYTASLAKLENGDVVLSILEKGARHTEGYGWNGQLGDDGSYIMHFHASTSIIPNGKNPLYSSWPCEVIKNIAQYSAITIGPGSGKVIWSSGETIPAASAGMEAYYQAVKVLERFNRETLKKHLDEQLSSGEFDEDYNNMTDAETQTQQTLLDQLHLLRTQVPEWQ